MGFKDSARRRTQDGGDGDGLVTQSTIVCLVVGEATSVNEQTCESAQCVVRTTSTPRRWRKDSRFAVYPRHSLSIDRRRSNEDPAPPSHPIPAAMPTTRSVAVRTDVTRTTGRATASRTIMPLRTSSVPVWLIKLITVIVAITVLVLILLQGEYIRTKHAMSFLITALTCGILLGWSIGSVLQQVLTIRNVEIIANTCMTVLSIASLVCAAYILIKNDDYSHYDWYAKEIGVLICFIIQSIVCLLMLSWALYGTIIVVETR
uniref:Uncharacterized protein n=1 Tax=Plectus sambesii TaxID=2011161 RepID=A0A914X009_9BILA